VRRPGFTLLELQVAIFLGVVVVSLFGLLLTLEVERGVRTKDRAELRTAIARVDGTVQWSLFGANQVLVAPDRVVVQGRGQSLELSSSGCALDGVALLDPKVAIALEEAVLVDGLLRASVRLETAHAVERVDLEYVLETHTEVIE